MLTLACTEAELPHLTSLLESHGVAYEASYLGSSSFPSLDVSDRKCQVLVLGELTAELRDQLTDLVGMEAVHESSDAPKAKKRSWKRILLVGYAVVVTLGWAYNYYLYRHTMEDKNFTYSWNLEGTTLVCSDKLTGRLVSTYIDRNYNFSFEKGIQYYSNGHLSVMRDQDEDGFYETLTYTSNGQLAQEWHDLDKDGQHESGRFILENGDTLQLTDSDADGFFEIVH